MNKEVKLCHTLAGAKTPGSVGDEFWEIVKNQMLRVDEEVKEALVAAHDKNLKELVDGILDSLYCLVRMNQLLAAVGVDLEGAWDHVAANNLSKFTQDESVARASVHHLQQKNPGEMFFYQRVELGGNSYYPVLRGVDCKVCKPVNYVPVDLEPYLEGVSYE